jgi:anti-sigma B factor antagonist
MKLTLLFNDDQIVGLRCEGQITLSHIKPGLDHLEQVAGLGVYSRRVLLDLEKTSYIDSAGIGWLMTCHKRFKSYGGRMVLHSIPPLIRQTLDLLKLHRIFALAVDEESARRMALEEEKEE